MFTKIVRLILLRDMLRRGGYDMTSRAVQEADTAARFVLKGEVPTRPAPRPNAGYPVGSPLDAIASRLSA